MVFFDDILVYSRTEEAHISHLKHVLEILRKHQLYVKEPKCSFGQGEVDYLGHVISKAGVAVDKAKIQCVVDWPEPKNIKALRGFLGLTSYYRKFVQGYGVLAKPLTSLLKKGQFEWRKQAQEAFEALKRAMTQTPVLQLPDFKKPFVVETDACYHGVGAVLMQEGHSIAYLSKALGPRNLGLSVYEKELLAILLAVQKWRPYLLWGTFTIRTDQQSLKHLLEQKISTPLQHKYLAKLLGFNYSIEYKKGIENQAADALSRRDADGEITQITAVQPLWIQEVIQSYEGDNWAQEAILESTLSPFNVSYFHYSSGILKYKGRVYVGSNGELREKIIIMIHTSSLGGHSGIQNTYQRVSATFLWPQLRQQVHKIVQECSICQLNKHENVKAPGMLQPLPIPEQAWDYISMDFIEKLPNSKGKEVIWVIVDRLTKYSHFIALSHPISASGLAQVFIETVYKLHGLPSYIVSDRDPLFTSQFWKDLMKVIGVQHNLSTAYHPQTDGQTERVNQCLESYLRCMCGRFPKQWATWLPLAEWWYNTSYHSTIKATPFEALYGYKPPQLGYGPFVTVKTEGVGTWVKDHQVVLHQLKQLLQQAQQRMKQQENKKRSERVFKEGEWVYLKLKPYKQLSLHKSRMWKLTPKYCGPFEVIQCVGPVAYKLQLPPGTKFHPVFHVSQLKKHVGAR